jgi:hypothetical protein
MAAGAQIASAIAEARTSEGDRSKASDICRVSNTESEVKVFTQRHWRQASWAACKRKAADAKKEEKMIVMTMTISPVMAD